MVNIFMSIYCCQIHLRSVSTAYEDSPVTAIMSDCDSCDMVANMIPSSKGRL